MKVLEATGIRKRFGGVVALSNGNLACNAGRITGLLGANGSGKSTISKIIAGVYHADAGQIRYNDKVVRYRTPNEARQNGIAMVFQNLSLVPDLTVWQNIVLGGEQSRGPFLNDARAKETAGEILDNLMPGLGLNRMISELSPGEMQIVEIAKAICGPAEAPDPRRADGGAGKGAGEEPVHVPTRSCEEEGGGRVHLPSSVGGDGDLRRGDDLPKRGERRADRFLEGRQGP